MSAPEVHEDRSSDLAPIAHVIAPRRNRRPPRAAGYGRHRAGAIAATVVLLSGAGVGAAYGLSSAPARVHVPESSLSLAAAPSVVLPVAAPTLAVTAGALAPSELAQRVDGLVGESRRIVAEKAAQREAEEAARAALAAQKAKERAAADAPWDKTEGDGHGCPGKDGGGASYWGA